jgi:hypothetical protein
LNVRQPYTGKEIVITLPEGKGVNNFKQWYKI